MSLCYSTRLDIYSASYYDSNLFDINFNAYYSFIYGNAILTVKEDVDFNVYFCAYVGSTSSFSISVSSNGVTYSAGGMASRMVKINSTTMHVSKGSSITITSSGSTSNIDYVGIAIERV